MFHRILVATDFSSASKPAVAEAVRLAKETGAELLVAHVYEPPHPSAFEDYVTPPSLYQEWEEALRIGSEESLRPLVEDAQKQGVTARALVLRGVTYHEIVEAAEDNGVDLVLVGTHGRSGLSRFLLGSVAERVISSSRCPVMAVRSF